jgi:erythromycin esterase-like protein
MRHAESLAVIRENATVIGRGRDAFGPLLQRAARSKVVLLGEASHGTHEFYAQRAELTKSLIRDHGFQAVAAEADWPDAHRVHRFVKGRGPDLDANNALADFRRFPSWMWRNADILDFVGWLREHNDALPRERKKAGFYGLDLYSLHTSIAAVLAYLDKVDADAAQRARYRYGCFEHTSEDPQAYGYAASFGLSESCEQEVIAQLVELRRRAAELAGRDGRLDPDEFFFVEQNARVVKNAEQYYRSMFGGRVESWNLRDSHMMETLENLLAHLGSEAKIVVWAHNSHLGDARATAMGDSGELNLGQLVRERYGDQAFLIGFSTYSGSVTAASDWGAPAERKRVRPALAGSWERLFHETLLRDFVLLMEANSGLREALSAERLERAIGVIYLPETERQSHYFEARLAQQFDTIIHIDETRAVEPLERTSDWETGELPETYPSAV